MVNRGEEKVRVHMNASYVCSTLSFQVQLVVLPGIAQPLFFLYDGILIAKLLLCNKEIS